MAGLPGLFINVRTDVSLYGIGVPEARLDDVLTRSGAYAQADADSLFVPGLTDLQAITDLAEASSLPVNVMAGPGAPPVAELAAAGVRRDLLHSVEDVPQDSGIPRGTDQADGHFHRQRPCRHPGAARN